MPASEARHLLILGGTVEARELAAVATVRFASRLRVTTSLAGRTRRHAPLAGGVRSGGFGGARGLMAYLRTARIDLVVDATHPFATHISAVAREVCRELSIPLLTLIRPGWMPQPADRWIMVADAADAAARVSELGRRAFLTIGRSALTAFSRVESVHFLVRLVDSPAAPLPLASYEVIAGRGPFAQDEERSIMKRYAIDVLVTKASGGAATKAKLDAARALDVPVIMLRRPPDKLGDYLGDYIERIEDAVAWLDRHVENSGEMVWPIIVAS